MSFIYFCHVLYHILPCYTHRLPQRGSIGERFFQKSTNISLMKRMKKRLNDTIQYYQQKAVHEDKCDECLEDEATSSEEYTLNRESLQNDDQLSLTFTK